MENLLKIWELKTMKNEIKLLKNNDKRIDTDLEWVEEFYEFLKGEVPKMISLRRGHKPKMSEKKLFLLSGIFKSIFQSCQIIL